jgi:hypothetical protein
MAKKYDLYDVEIVEMIDAVPFETYNSLPKIEFIADAKINGKKVPVYGIMKIMGNDQIEFDFSDEWEENTYFDKWMQEFDHILTAIIMREINMILMEAQYLEEA